MKDIKREITKELYDKFVYAPYGEQKVLVSDYLGAVVVCGYGLYSYTFSEENGKYYLCYTRGDSCD